MPKDRPTDAEVTNTVFMDIEIGGEPAGRDHGHVRGLGIAPVPKPYTKEKARKISDVEDVDAFHKIRMARADYRLFGIRQRNRLVKEAAEK